jgi:hypothetical protein
LNANSSVFYLSFNNGGKSERTCKVSTGKALLLILPVMQTAITDQDIPSVEELESHREDSVNSLYLRIGDEEDNYDGLLKYRTHTVAFDVISADKAIFGILEDDPTKNVADGFYNLAESITNGSYSIHFKSFDLPGSRLC